MQPRLLYRASTVSTLFDLMDGIQMPLSFGSREEGEWDKKKGVGGVFFCVCVWVLTHLQKRGQFDLLN